MTPQTIFFFLKLGIDIEKRKKGDSTRIRLGHPLTNLVHKLREDERVAKQYRIEFRIFIVFFFFFFSAFYDC